VLPTPILHSFVTEEPPVLISSLLSTSVDDLVLGSLLSTSIVDRVIALDDDHGIDSISSEPSWTRLSSVSSC
jgi:hypothetical protein